MSIGMMLNGGGSWMTLENRNEDESENSRNSKNEQQQEEKACNLRINLLQMGLLEDTR